MQEQATSTENTGKTPSSLTKRSVIGATWIVVGYGASQVLRLASNLVLTRLLAPEHFGLMALVNVFMIGLAMFSDVGIGPSIIQSDRSEDKNFLNTAWTVQVIRGFVIWFCCIVGAWPFMKFYGDPMLLWLIPVAGLTSVISGFNATSIFTTNRNLALGQLTLLEIGSQIAAITLMVSVALIHPSVWVLVAGSLFAGFVKMLASHWWLPGISNRFCWDKTALHVMVKFGRWIFVSTFLSFFINSAASLILGKFMNMVDLGLFSIAATLAKVVENLYDQVSNKVLLPVYAHIKHMQAEELRARIGRVRRATIAAFLPMLWIIVVMGQQLIDLLFDSRYHNAGSMFRIYAAGLIPVIISGIGPFYLAMGNSLLALKLETAKFIFYVGAILIGGWLDGATGIIVALAAQNLLVYLANIYVQRLYSVWIAWLDAVAILASAAIVWAGFHFNPIPHLS